MAKELWIMELWNYGGWGFCNVEVAKIKKKARGRKNMRVMLARVKEKLYFCTLFRAIRTEISDSRGAS